jgi:hypothetical protein
VVFAGPQTAPGIATYARKRLPFETSVALADAPKELRQDALLDALPNVSKLGVAVDDTAISPAFIEATPPSAICLLAFGEAC